MNRVALAVVLALLVAAAAPCVGAAVCTSPARANQCRCCGDEPRPCCSTDTPAPVVPANPEATILAPTPDAALPNVMAPAGQHDMIGAAGSLIKCALPSYVPLDPLLLTRAFRC